MWMGDALGAGEHRVDDQEWSRIAPVVDRSRALRDRDTVPVSRLVLPVLFLGSGSRGGEGGSGA